MSKKLISLLLCLVFMFSLIPAFSTPVQAADDVEITNPNEATDESGNLHFTKALTPGSNGTYDITMESWATGSVETHKYNEQIPTDYVLVADQSGSMTTKDVPTGGWTGKTTNWYCPQDPDAVLNTYYKETDANGVDHYYRVYRKRGDLFQYHAPNTVYIGNCVDDLGWFQRETTQLDSDGANSPYWYNPALDTSNKRIGNENDNNFYPLMISSQGGLAEYWIRFRFTDETGTKRALQWTDDIWYAKPAWNNEPGGYFKPGDRYAGVITYDFASSIAKRLADNDPERYTYARVGMDVPFVGWVGLTTGMYVRQTTFTRFVGYNQLAYKDDNGVEHLLMDATYCDGNGKPVGGRCDSNSGVPTGGMESTDEAYWYGTLYTPDENQNITRLQALQAAMTEFINTVSTQENDDGSKPNHRVAIAGFSSASSKNTELLTGKNIDTSASNKDGVRYASITEQQYKDALLDVTDANQLAKLRNAVQALDADGGTEGEYGLYMAKNILDKRELTKFTTRGGQEVDRLTIIVYFTDGTPGPYEYSNQYEYGNKVVDAAKQIKKDGKIPNAEIYSIGTFGFADADPMTYQKHSGNDDVKYQYDPDYVGKMSSLFNNRYIYRIWRRNTKGYGDIATDTVGDYMRTITTEYKDATQFVDPTWYDENATRSDGGNYVNMVNRVRGESNGNRRYFLATDLSALNRVFTTIGSEEASSSSTVKLNDQATLQDKVNLTYFDVANASTEAYTVTANRDGSFGTEKVQTLAAPLDKDTGKVTVSGFDYSTKYVTDLQDGEKLIVKIKGLVAKQPGTEMPSNDGKAFIKAPDAEANAVEITSPTLTLQAKPNTFLIDYNAKMTVANDTSKLLDAKDNTVTGNNGKFVKSGTNVTYQLDSGNQASKTAEINKGYTGVDTATIYGTPVNGTAGWNQITTVPASSVYYDDDLAKDTAPAVTVGDGSGKIAGINDGNVSVNADNATGPFYFTFYGTGIDVYCTTHKGAGYVTATLFKAGQEGPFNKSTRVESARTIKNYSSENLYNTPTISYSVPTADTYTLKITANEGAEYKLDGIRVYNPVKKGTEAEDKLNTTNEKNATYLNLRRVLLNDEVNGVFTVRNDIAEGEINPSAVSGVLYIDDVSQVITESNWYKDDGAATETWHDTPAKIYQSQFDVYKTNGPNNEIYLAKANGNTKQAITFQVNTDKVPAGTTIYLGLSTPDGGSGSGTISVTGNGNISVGSVMDMYYPIIVPENGLITITNEGSRLISITNLKITGVKNLIPDATSGNEQEILNATRALFAPVSMKMVRMAANQGIDPEDETVKPEEPTTPENPTVTDEPGETEKPDDGSLVIDEPDNPTEPTPEPSVEPQPQTTGSVIQRIIQSITKSISSFFKSIFRR